MNNPPLKKYDVDIPVYNGKFKDAVDKIRLVLKDFQHGMRIVQNEENGVTASVEVTITLRK